jgi:hypothetical protein
MSITRDYWSLVIGLWLGALGAACVGTPTPEPPDFLPRPEAGLISMGPVTTGEVGPSEILPVQVMGEPGAVAGETDVWLVNLDSRDVDPVYARAAADGSFRTEIAGLPGDRVRLISRTLSQHSLPLDFEVVFANMQLGLSRLPDTSLACLEVLPSEQLSLAPNGEEVFVITNDCAEPASLESSALRFGDQGFSLADTVKTVAPGDSVELRVAFGPGSSAEQADIVLLELVAGEASGRYALGVWGL